MAIAAYHALLGGQSVGRDPLVTRFLRGVMRLRPQVRSRVPHWDIAVMLETLYRPPFELIDELSDRHLMLKTYFILPISSFKRVVDLEALSVAPLYIDFAPGLAKAFLYPRAGMSLRSPPLHHGLPYCRLSVLLPSGSLTSRGQVIVCVQCEHWMHTSTELPCGEGWTDCSFSMAPLR